MRTKSFKTLKLEDILSFPDDDRNGHWDGNIFYRKSLLRTCQKEGASDFLCQVKETIKASAHLTIDEENSELVENLLKQKNQIPFSLYWKDLNPKSDSNIPEYFIFEGYTNKEELFDSILKLKPKQIVVLENNKLFKVDNIENKLATDYCTLYDPLEVAQYKYHNTERSLYSLEDLEKHLYYSKDGNNLNEFSLVYGILIAKIRTA